MKKLIMITLLSICSSVFAAEQNPDAFYDAAFENVVAKEIATNKNFRLSQCRILNEKGELKADDSFNRLIFRFTALANHSVLEIYSKDRLATSYLTEESDKTALVKGANWIVKLAEDNTMVIWGEGLIFCKTQ